MKIKKRSKAYGVLKKALVFSASAVFIALVLFFGEKSRETVRASLVDSALRVIPAVFPMAVLGGLFGKGAVAFPGFLTRAAGSVFGTDEYGGSALFTGLVFGFPTGTASAEGFYRRGLIAEDELVTLSALSCNAGAPFVISFVGGNLLGSTGKGLLIWLSLALSEIAAARFCRLPKKKKIRFTDENSLLSGSAPENSRIVPAFTSCVQDASRAMLSLCAFAASFSLINLLFSETAVGLLLPRGKENAAKFVRAISGGFFEISRGTLLSSLLGRAAGCTCALTVGWSGLSLICQTLAYGNAGKVRSAFGRIAAIRGIISVMTAVLYAISEKIFFSA